MACQGAIFNKERAEKTFQDILKTLKENGVDLLEVQNEFSLFMGSQVKKREELKSLIYAVCWTQDCMDF